MSSRRRAIMGIAKSGGRLPSEYQEVEYLESTGEQYIDTGVDWLDTYGFNINFMPFSLSGEGLHYFGSYSPTTRIVLSNWNSQGMSGNFVSGFLGNNAHLTLNEYNEVEFISGIYSVNNYVYYEELLNNATNTHFMLFNTQQRISLNRQGALCRINFVILYDNNTQICNFIPCYRKADNKPGLYDLVNGVFYVNANTSASQDFIVGPDVN